jgi:hypothetical protein
MLDVVTFKWKSSPGYRSKFGAEAVNVLARMVARHYQHPHRFTCITDDSKGIDGSIRVIPLWSDHASLLSPHGRGNPSCYRRLKLFSVEAAEFIGPRFVSLDLDIVITGDLSPLWNRPEDFVMWKSVTPATYYNGSMLLMTAGTRRKVWDDFDPINSPRLTRMHRQFGSDQAWISYKLGPNEATWDTVDGVYSYRLHIDAQMIRGKYVKMSNKDLPSNAKVVVFHGADDPWGPNAQRLRWVREHYR